MIEDGSGQPNPLTDRGPAPELSIVGVGNEIMGDDGVGPTVVRRLEDSELAANDDVSLVNAGTTGFFALEALSGAAFAIVIDAIETGAEPGTIHEYRCVEGSFESTPPDMTMHDISFTEALSAGRDVYDFPDEIRILGVEPDRLEPGTELSETVEAAAEELIQMLPTIARTTDATTAEPEPTNSKSKS